MELRLFAFILLAACTSRRARAEFAKTHRCQDTSVTATPQGDEHFHLSGCGYEEDFDCRSQPCVKVRHGEDRAPQAASAPAAPEVDLTPLNNTRNTEVRACYAQAWKTNPTLNGYLFIEFTIEKDGSVSNTKVSRSTLQDQTLEACVAKKVRALRFAPQPAPTNMSVPFFVRP